MAWEKNVPGKCWPSPCPPHTNNRLPAILSLAQMTGKSLLQLLAVLCVVVLSRKKTGFSICPLQTSRVPSEPHLNWPIGDVGQFKASIPPRLPQGSARGRQLRTAARRPVGRWGRGGGIFSWRELVSFEVKGQTRGPPGVKTANHPKLISAPRCQWVWTPLPAQPSERLPHRWRGG